MSVTRTFFSVALLTSALVWAQDAPSVGVPARVVISAGHFYSAQPPVLTPEDVDVTEGVDSLPVLSVTPLHGPVEIFILVDNCSSCEPGTKFEELRKFINSQPPATSIGVAYIRDGKLEIAQSPSSDRKQAIKTLNVPTGSQPSNPFFALADLITQWKPDSSRHIVVMISNGLDPKADGISQNGPAEASIEAAERSGVAVFAMYHPSADYAAADWEKLYAGQVQLSHVATESGGEAYFLGFGPMPSLAPFLNDVADHLANQYQVEFLAKPGAAGTLDEVVVKSRNRDVDIMAPARVWIPAASAPPVPSGKR